MSMCRRRAAESDLVQAISALIAENHAQYGK